MKPGEPQYGALNTRDSDFQVTNGASGMVDVYSYPAFSYEYSYDGGIQGGPEGITQAP